jgi:hypothetical protein
VVIAGIDIPIEGMKVKIQAASPEQEFEKAATSTSISGGTP